VVAPPLLELPPKKPPEKKPPPKPKPPPEEPPTTTTPLLPPLDAIIGGGGGGGTNIGGTMVRVVTVAGAAQTVRRTVRRTTRRWTVRARRTWPVRAFACLTIAGRGGGFSATWTAPPPTIAPPQVQAQSFAKAILTDITASLFLAFRLMGGRCPVHRRRGCSQQMQTIPLSASALTIFVPKNGRIRGR